MGSACAAAPAGPFDRVAVYLGRFFADWAEGVGDWTRRGSSIPIEVREQTTAARISLYDNIPINAMIEEAFPSIDRGRGTIQGRHPCPDPRLFK